MKQHNTNQPNQNFENQEFSKVAAASNPKMIQQKQSISFIKSLPKTLEDEDNINFDQDSSFSSSSEDEKDNKDKNQNQHNLQLPKQNQNLESSNEQKHQDNYQIIVKSTFEEDAFAKIGNHESDLDNIPSTQINLVTRTDSNQSSDQDIHQSGQKKWNKVKNVLKGIQLFSKLEVETISKPSEIDIHLSQTTRSNSLNRDLSPENRQTDEEQTASQLFKNLQLEAKQNAAREQWKLIDDFKYRKKFFQAIETGSPDDIQYIEEYLKDDPKRYLIVEESSERRMNKADSFGQTPLYCAAKNGNLEVLKVLVKYKVNHKLMTYLNNDQTASDTAINVAARWGHVKVVEYLLDTFVWDKNELKTASKSTNNKEIKNLISKKL